MTVIITIACAFCAYVLIKNVGAAKAEAKRQEAEAERQAEAKRIREEWKQQQAEAREWTRKQAAIEREQMRQAREQERQAAQLEKHEKRLADLEERMAIAEGEIEFQAQQIARLREHIEHAETERDACVYGSTRYYQWDKKCLVLEKQIHTAESKMAKAQYTKTSAAKELAA